MGTIPPPIGGVSMHIQRFYEHYKDREDIKISLFDIKKSPSIIELLKNIYSVDIVHIHLSNNLKIFIALLSKLFGKEVIYTHHNIRVNNIFLFRLLMVFVDKLILVNDKDIDKEVKERYNYYLIPAFLPSLDREELPNNILQKIKSFDNTIATNCFRKTFINDKDLYGFDILVEAFWKLVNRGEIKNTLLILVDPSNTSKEYVEELLKKYPIQSRGCEVLYIGEAINFNELIKETDMTIRATRSDGDSLSVRESLFLKKPIIASDVTIRPEGTILFRNEDSNDLAEKIKKVLNREIDTTNNSVDNNYGDEVISLYLDN